jgi:hypothetical protein
MFGDGQRLEATSRPSPAEFYGAAPLGRNGKIKAGKNSDYFIA